MRERARSCPHPVPPLKDQRSLICAYVTRAIVYYIVEVDKRFRSHAYSLEKCLLSSEYPFFNTPWKYINHAVARARSDVFFEKTDARFVSETQSDSS